MVLSGKRNGTMSAAHAPPTLNVGAYVCASASATVRLPPTTRESEAAVPVDDAAGGLFHAPFAESCVNVPALPIVAMNATKDSAVRDGVPDVTLGVVLLPRAFALAAESSAPDGMTLGL